MLWENDGSATDVVNAITEITGDGALMDSFRRKLTAEADAKHQALITDFNDIATRVHETERVAENETGLIPDFSIPAILYHQYAAEFRFKAAELGITLEGNGYECWYCPDFIKHYKKKHPEMVHVEAKRAASIIVPGNKYGSVTSPEANRTSFTHGGMIAA
jgi:hypothetical protein